MPSDSSTDATPIPESAPLYETDAGAVLYCDCCGRFQVTFDEIVLLLTTPGCGRLLDTMAQVVPHAREAPPRWWRLYTPTDAGPISVTVRSSELLDLYDLLKGASVMLELGHLLDTATP
ncbi:MAG: hypothetical protein GVY18_15835 [Bacteroidetes bacterium]|jgi:hypothetical protein|nr:hypothetical protein [Bacteroidota bacterium]